MLHLSMMHVTCLQLLGGNGRTAGERRIGVIVMDDILEHAPAGAAKYMAQILPVLLQAAQDKVCVGAIHLQF